MPVMSWSFPLLLFTSYRGFHALAKNINFVGRKGGKGNVRQAGKNGCRSLLYFEDNLELDREGSKIAGVRVSSS